MAESPTASNYLSLGFPKAWKGIKNKFRNTFKRSKNASAMLNGLKIERVEKELNALQKDLQSKRANLSSNIPADEKELIAGNVENIEGAIDTRMGELRARKNDRNAAAEAAKLKRLDVKVTSFKNTIRKLFTRKATGSSSRKNVMNKASRALNQLTDMGGIATSLGMIAKSIEGCCDKSDDRSVAPSNLGNNNRHGGPDGENGPGGTVPAIENEGDLNAARNLAGARAGENNNGRAGNNAGERVNNFGQNVGSLFANAPNAPPGAPYPVRPGAAARGDTGRAANNAGERVNDYGEDIGSLFNNAPNAPPGAPYPVRPGAAGRAANNAGDRINEYGEGVGNLFANASNAPAAYEVARGTSGRARNNAGENITNEGETRRAAINAARAEQEARRRANANAGPGGLNNFEPGGRLPNNFFNEEEDRNGRVEGPRGLAATGAEMNNNLQFNQANSLAAAEKLPGNFGTADRLNANERPANYGTMDGLFNNAPSAPNEYEIARGVNNSVKPSRNLEKNMANAARNRLSKSLTKANPLTSRNANVEAFKARKRAERASPAVGLAAGAAAPPEVSSQPLTGFKLTGTQPKSPANITLEEAAKGVTLNTLTPDERARYNAMRNLNESISEANALGMLQQNRNMGRNKPFENKKPVRKTNTRGKKKGRKSRKN